MLIFFCQLTCFLPVRANIVSNEVSFLVVRISIASVKLNSLLKVSESYLGNYQSSKHMPKADI